MGAILVGKNQFMPKSAPGVTHLNSFCIVALLWHAAGIKMHQSYAKFSPERNAKSRITLS